MCREQSISQSVVLTRQNTLKCVNTTALKLIRCSGSVRTRNHAAIWARAYSRNRKQRHGMSPGGFAFSVVDSMALHLRSETFLQLDRRRCPRLRTEGPHEVANESWAITIERRTAVGIHGPHFNMAHTKGRPRSKHEVANGSWGVHETQAERPWESRAALQHGPRQGRSYPPTPRPEPTPHQRDGDVEVSTLHDRPP